LCHLVAISEKDTKILYSRSAGLCNICKESVLNQVYDYVIQNGERCHIHGKREGAARYIHQVGEDNTYNNLILLCPIHHKYIDDLEEQFSVQYLLDTKWKHEKAIAANPYLQTNSDQVLVAGIFKIFPMMYYYDLVISSDPKKIPISILDILDIENTLQEKYSADYPFSNAMLQLTTASCFYNLRMFKKHLSNEAIYVVPDCSTYFYMIEKPNIELLVSSYKYYNLFIQTFKQWYAYCKHHYVI